MLQLPSHYLCPQLPLSFGPLGLFFRNHFSHLDILHRASNALVQSRFEFILDLCQERPVGGPKTLSKDGEDLPVLESQTPKRTSTQTLGPRPGPGPRHRESGCHLRACLTYVRRAIGSPTCQGLDP